MEDLKIFNLDRRYANLFDKEDMIAGRKNGKWKKYSCSEYIQTADSIGSGLLNLGITKGDKVCIISSNRTEWSLCDMGINKIGAINTPLYPNITRAEYKYIIKDSEAKLIFVENDEIYKKIEGLENEVESLKFIFSFDKLSNVKNWEELIELGLTNPQFEKMNAIQNSISDDDLFTLILSLSSISFSK